MSLPAKYPLLTLMQLEAKHVAELNKILTMSVNRLEQDIKALGKKGANPITIMQAKATKASLESFLGQTFDSMEDVIRVGMKDAAAAASGVVSAYEAQMLGLVMSPEAVANLAKSEAQRAAMGIEAALKRVQGSSYVPLSETVYNTKQMTLGWVEKRITQGLASGWSAQKLANELKGMINPNVKGGVSYAAMRTARTEINNSFHASSAERYLNSPVVLEVDWHLSSSHPEGDICDDLASDSPYPKKSVPHKPHPNCYCYITPRLPEPAKFIDNLLKGKYGSPPTGAAAQAVKANLPKAAGSKAASTLAQNAMHAAIKNDVKPSKANLGAQFGWSKELSQKSIANLGAFDELVKGMDDVTKAYVKNNGIATQKYAAAVLPDEVEGIGAHLKAMAHPKAPPAKTWDDAIVGKFPQSEYDELAEFYDLDLVEVLQKNNISPAKIFNLQEGMDEEEYLLFKDIIYNAKNPANTKFLLQALDLDTYDNTMLGQLQQLAKGLPPKKVWTGKDILDEFGVSMHTIDNLYDAQKLTTDQIVAQLAKFTPDELADIKKLGISDQGYYIKMGTTPTKDSFLKPVAGAGDVPVPKTTYADLEEEYGTPAHVWEKTGLSADDVAASLKHIETDKVLSDILQEGFDDFDDDLILDAIKKGHLKAKPPIIDPDTIPLPKVPDLPNAPKPVLESYGDVADSFPKGEWKPNLLQKTGATPQQIAEYVEDMSPADYDHFMSLKWPSQKKHFEKLATKTDNASTYEAKVAFQNADTALPKPAKPLTSDPEVLAKWQGKVQPPKPLEPKPPTTPGKAAYDDFLEKSKKKFKDFAASTGNAKNDLTKSNNWAKFQDVVSNNNLTALKQLQAEKYIDQDLYDLAVAAGKKATTPDPGDAAKFKSAMDAYAKAKAQFDADVAEWRIANGITSQAKGVWDGALVHRDNAVGVAWANKNLAQAAGAPKTAAKKYSGGAYSQWNNTLRSHADPNSVPSGSWGAHTANLDKAFAPLPEDVVVRRGTSWTEFEMNGVRKGMIPPPPPSDLVGSVQTSHAYTSTSVGQTSAFGGSVNMRIRVPQGNGAVWLDPYSSHKGERELLLPRSTNFYIHDVYQENGRWYVDAEVIPAGEDASMWSPIKSANRPR